VRLAETQAKLTAFLSGETELPEDLLSEVVSPRGVSGRESLALYREGVQQKIAERLANVFPKVEAFMAPAAFRALSDAHARACPRPDRSIENLARRLPVFLRGYGAREDLADLAELELARWDVAEEADEEPVTPAALVSLAASHWGAARLHFVAAARLLRLRFEVDEVWESLDAGRPAPGPTARAVVVLVWRRGRKVYHSAVDDEEGEALQAVQRGAALADVCDAFRGNEDPAGAAYAALHGWFADGLMARVEATPPLGVVS
jgi:Putative DNA-binding domain